MHRSRAQLRLRDRQVYLLFPALGASDRNAPILHSVDTARVSLRESKLAPRAVR